MKFLIALAFAGVLLAGCSDSSTEPTATSDAGSADTGNTDTGGSTDTGGTDTGGSADTGNTDAGGSTDTGGTNTGGSTIEPEPEPSTIKFTGDDFGYPLFYTVNDTNSYSVQTLDERVAYTVWAVNYVEAHSLLEAMHAINGYREDFQQIKIVNGATQDLNSLINDYCPTSGASFTANRCEFYARLAYTKTMAQDGWQIEHRENNAIPLSCWTGWASKFAGCSYDLIGAGYQSESGNPDALGVAYASTDVSPIEGWQYEYNQPKITAINRAAQSYIFCATETEEDRYSYLYRNLRPTLSPWPFAPNADQVEATQYGVLIAWIINDDTVEDVYTDVTAEHDGSNLCKAKFQLDLKDVQPNASF